MTTPLVERRRYFSPCLPDGLDDAEKAFDLFARTYAAKCPKAVERLEKGRGLLLTFYDFPVKHRRHIRTTNRIESTFAAERLRTVKTKGSGSRTSVSPWSSS
jgi:transposase-like protein